ARAERRWSAPAERPATLARARTEPADERLEAGGAVPDIAGEADEVGGAMAKAGEGERPTAVSVGHSRKRGEVRTEHRLGQPGAATAEGVGPVQPGRGSE